MPSVQATVGYNNFISPVTNGTLGTRVVIVDGQYVNKINFNITANNNMGVGWDATHPNNNGVSVGGAYTGTKTIYDASWGQTLNSGYGAVQLFYYTNGSSQINDSGAGLALSNSTQANPVDVSRARNPMNTGDMYFALKHNAENATGNEVQIIGNTTLPLPTFRLIVSDSSLVGHPTNTDITYQKWEHNGFNMHPYAYFPLTINPAPNVGDTVLHIKSNSTPYQYHTTDGEDEYYNLKRPSIYTKTTLFPYNNVANEMGHTTNLNYAGTTYVKVLMETNQWGQIDGSGKPYSDMSVDWEATGNRAQYMSQTSGTISTWRAVTGHPTLAVGYSPPITVTASGLSGYDNTSIELTNIVSYETNPTIIRHYA